MDHFRAAAIISASPARQESLEFGATSGCQHDHLDLCRQRSIYMERAIEVDVTLHVDVAVWSYVAAIPDAASDHKSAPIRADQRRCPLAGFGKFLSLFKKYKSSSATVYEGHTVLMWDSSESIYQGNMRP